MVVAKTFIVLSFLFTAAFAGETPQGRHFLPTDITGDYKLSDGQDSCAKSVNLKDFSQASAGAYFVPHFQISEDDVDCTGHGAFSIVTMEAILNSGNEFVLETEPLSTAVSALKSQGATFMLGFEKEARQCGSGGISAKSMAIFVEEEMEISIPGLMTLSPGSKYMIFYDPSLSTPCTYSIKIPQRLVDVPVTPDPTTTPTPFTVEAGSSGESTEFAMAETDQPTSTGGASGGHTTNEGADSDAPMDSGAAMDAGEHTDAFDNGAAEDDHAGHDHADHDHAAHGASAGSEDFTAVQASTEAQPGDMGASMMDDGYAAGEETIEPSASAEPDDESTCFPGEATVELENGTTKRMDEVMIGDRVKVGATEFSDVFMFTHKLSTVKSPFVELETERGHKLSLSKGHYIYANGKLVSAGSVTVGDKLEVDFGTATVRMLSETVKVGLFNPQTVQGDILVNGFRTSTYTTAVEKLAAHSLLTPIRAAFRMCGFSTKILETGAGGFLRIMPSGITSS